MWRRLRGLLFLAFIMVAACSTAQPLTPEPTQILIVPTPTSTPLPVVVTPTATSLPRPADLLEPSPTTALSEQATSEIDLLTQDPIAAELVALAQRRVAEELDLPTRRIQVVEVKLYVWPDVSLGCPLPGETYEAAQIDGYRIVLQAGDVVYLFHTDVDRVVSCDAANEQLPAESDD